MTTRPPTRRKPVRPDLGKPELADMVEPPALEHSGVDDPHHDDATGGSRRCVVDVPDCDARTVGQIIDRLALGEDMMVITQDDDMPSLGATMRRISQDPDLTRRYREAYSLRADRIFDELIALADEDDIYEEVTIPQEDGSVVVENVLVKAVNVPRQALRVKTRQWVLSRMAPAKYGDVSRVLDAGTDAATYGDRLAKATALLEAPNAR